MSQEFVSPPPMQSAASQPWNEVWISAITKPSVETFEDLFATLMQQLTEVTNGSLLPA